MNNKLQSSNIQPLPKRPKLDIALGNQEHSSTQCRSNKSESPGGDIIYELFERDANAVAQHEIDVDKQAFLTSPKSVSQTTVRDMIDEIWGDDLDVAAIEKVHLDESMALSQMPEKIKPIENITKRSHLSVNNKPAQMTSNPHLPWRRTVSSGWPTASSSFAAKNVIDNHSKQNSVEQLLLENNNLKAQLTRKAGEANLIRDRLHNIEHECDKLKKEHSEKIDVMKKEAERNCAQLSKEIRSLKGQLEVKTMEMETAERRVQHISSLNKLNAESPRGMLRPVFSPIRVSARQSQKEDQLMCRHGQIKSKLHTYSLDYLKQLVTPELLKPSQPEPPIDNTQISCTNSLTSGQSSVPQQSTDGFLTKCSGSSVETLTTIFSKVNLPCASLEPCSLSLLSPRVLDISSNNTHQIILQVSEACIQILLETFQQPNVTSTPKYHLEKHNTVSMDLTQTVDLLCHKELFNKERGICARRVLALQSLLVEFSNFAVELIIPRPTTSDIATSSNIDTHHMLILIRDIFHRIKIKNSHNFDGMFAAVTALMKSLLQADFLLSQQSQDLIVQILQAVSFFHPGNLVLYYILQVLLAATKYPTVTASLCHNSDKCILQEICIMLQLTNAPRKDILSDLFTSWVMTLFYGTGLGSPKWLFSIPSQTCCRCRPFISRQCLTMLGEVCSLFSKVKMNEKLLLEKLLHRGVLLVSTLLYHDEHFGANVDPASEGHYELYIWSMNTLLETHEIKLSAASREVLESLSIQEGLRKPVYMSIGSEETHKKCDTYLRSLLLADIQYKEVLGILDT